MNGRRGKRVSGLAALGVALVASVLSAQGPARLPLPLEPFGDTGEAVFPVFEGWADARDGSGYYLVMGYKNRNRTQTIEVPIGPNNRIEPGGPDFGQPTVFVPGRQESQFAIKVPKDYGQKKLTWTLVVNGQTTAITFFLNPEYNMLVYREDSNGNEPPQVAFGPREPMLVGPNAGFAQQLTASVNQPVALTMWASDAPPSEKNWENIVSAQNRPKAVQPGREQVAIIGGQVLNGGGAPPRPTTPAPTPDITAVWTQYRGPGTVTFTPKDGVPIFTNGDPKKVVEARATATFSAPGEYWLRAEPVEADDGFDGLCCFTFALVKVTVK